MNYPSKKSLFAFVCLLSLVGMASSWADPPGTPCPPENRTIDGVAVCDCNGIVHYFSKTGWDNKIQHHNYDLQLPAAFPECIQGVAAPYYLFVDCNTGLLSSYFVCEEAKLCPSEIDDITCLQYVEEWSYADWFCPEDTTDPCP